MLSEKDEEKRQKFEKLFGFTFLQCLGHFSGKIYIEELKGLKTFKEKLFEKSDEAMYESKKHGKHTYTFYSGK